MKEWSYENDQWVRLPGHLKHLPLFTRHIDLVSMFIRHLWSLFLKYVFFQFYIRLEVVGDYHQVFKRYPRLLIISNHASHLDALSIAASIPFRYWRDLYIAAAKDYFFSNLFFTFFSKHCLGAIPIDRKDRKGEAIKLIVTLLETLPRMWLILFPEGTRSLDGKVRDFKRGVSIFSEKTQTPILYLFIEGNGDLWPKGAVFAKPGKLRIYVGPVKEPAPIEEVYADYKKWVMTFRPDAFVNNPLPQGD